MYVLFDRHPGDSILSNPGKTAPSEEEARIYRNYPTKGTKDYS